MYVYQDFGVIVWIFICFCIFLLMHRAVQTTVLLFMLRVFGFLLTIKFLSLIKREEKKKMELEH